MNNLPFSYLFTFLGEIVCKSFHLCAMSEQDYDEFEDCIKKSVLGYAPLLHKSTTERANSFAMKISDYSNTLIAINVSFLFLIQQFLCVHS